eukprot:scaffold52819_cov32-Tisochrysis_lutea.AAC.3
MSLSHPAMPQPQPHSILHRVGPSVVRRRKVGRESGHPCGMPPPAVKAERLPSFILIVLTRRASSLVSALPSSHVRTKYKLSWGRLPRAASPLSRLFSK